MPSERRVPKVVEPDFTAGGILPSWFVSTVLYVVGSSMLVVLIVYVRGLN